MPEQFQFVLHRPPDVDPSVFDDSVSAATQRLVTLAPTSLVLDTAMTGGQSMNTRRADGHELAALVSLRFQQADLAKTREVLDHLQGTGALVEGYRVEQDVPRDYERDWALGERSPGVRQLTLLRPKPGLTYDDFFTHWHQRHGPLALRIHPIWRYDRNVVHEALTEDAAPIAGIVALHFRELLDVTDPLRMYGGDTANIRVIFDDVSKFIDMKTIVVALMHERVLVG